MRHELASVAGPPMVVLALALTTAACSGGSGGDAGPSTSSVGQYCGAQPSLCAAAAPCLSIQCFSANYSICYDPSRPRCGPNNCGCAAGTRCYFPSCNRGPMDGVCLTEPEAQRLCAAPMAMVEGCDAGAPRPAVACP